MKRHALYIAWTVSLLGVFLSIYFGEILKVEPCRLCWYQRIALFPQILFLGIAAYKNEKKIALYAFPLVVLGGLVAIYQSLSQIFPVLQSHVFCGVSEHCYLESFFPYLSSAGFLLIALFVWLAPAETV